MLTRNKNYTPFFSQQLIACVRLWVCTHGCARLPSMGWCVCTHLQVEMGVPVFHGAFSTFLAIVMLSTAVSFSMRTFFKQFASVVIFGSFNALALLPCLLSFIGPAPLEGRGKNDELEMQVQGKGSGDDEDDSAAGGDSEEGQD